MSATIESPSVKDIAGLGVHELVGRFRLAIERLDPRVFEMGHEDLDRVFDESEGLGRWSCRQLLVHLGDCELVLAHRMRRVLAEESPMLGEWDHDAFLASPLSGPGGAAMGASEADRGREPILEPPGALAAVVHTTRMWLAATLYQLSESEWERAGMHYERGRVTLRDLVIMDTWHFDHHAAFLNAKVETLLGPMPEAGACGSTGQPVPAGGCGSGCGCVGKSETQSGTQGGGGA